MLLPTATLPATPMMYGGPGRVGAEERRRGRVQLLRRRDVQVQQPRQRQVDLDHLFHRHRLVQAAQRARDRPRTGSAASIRAGAPTRPARMACSGSTRWPRWGWSSCGTRAGPHPGSHAQRCGDPGERFGPYGRPRGQVEVAFLHRFAAYPRAAQGRVDAASFVVQSYKGGCSARARTDRGDPRADRQG